jgi:hypothetical protein
VTALMGPQEQRAAQARGGLFPSSRKVTGVCGFYGG